MLLSCLGAVKIFHSGLQRMVLKLPAVFLLVVIVIKLEVILWKCGICYVFYFFVYVLLLCSDYLILPCVWVTIDRAWIGSWICWLQVTVALSLIHTLYISLEHTLRLLRLLRFQSLPSKGFQRRTFFLFLVSELSTCISYQLLTGIAHNGRTAVL
jgi:hypothetical protein